MTHLKKILKSRSERQMASNKKNERLKSLRKKYKKAQKQSFTFPLLIMYE